MPGPRAVTGSRSSWPPRAALIADITVGDCLELIDAEAGCSRSDGSRHGPSFYQLLHAMGIFPPTAPATVRMFDPDLRAAHHRAADRPLRPRLPPRPGPARGLPARTPARDRLRHLARAWPRRWQACSGQTWRTTIPASTRCACPRHRRRMEAAAADQGQPRTRRAEAAREADRGCTAATYLTSVRAFYLDIAAWAAARPCPLGAVGRALPGPRRGSQFRKENRRAASPGWTHAPGNACPSCPSWPPPSTSARKDSRSPAAGRPRPPGPARCSPPAGDAAPPGRPRAAPPNLGRGPGHRQTPGPEPGRRQSVLGLGGRGGPPRHRHPDRGTDRTVAPQPHPVPAPVHRRAHPAAADRPVQDRPGASPGRIPGAGGRPQHRLAAGSAARTGPSPWWQPTTATNESGRRRCR